MTTFIIALRIVKNLVVCGCSADKTTAVSLRDVKYLNLTGEFFCYVNFMGSMVAGGMGLR